MVGMRGPLRLPAGLRPDRRRPRPARAPLGGADVEVAVRRRRGGQGRRRRLHRRLVLDGPGGRGRGAPPRLRGLHRSTPRCMDRAGRAGDLPALPARPPGRGGHRRGARRPAQPGRSRRPPTGCTRPAARWRSCCGVTAVSRGRQRRDAGRAPASTSASTSIAKLLAQHAVTSQEQLVDLLAAEGVRVHPGHRVARPRRPRRHQGAGRRRRVGLRHPRAARASSGPRATTCAGCSASGSSRSRSPATSSCCAPRRARPTSSAPRSTGPTCPTCSAPSPATTP